jgi:hypothetical protein
MTIKIKRATWISGEPVRVGEVLSVDDDTGKTLIGLKHADISKGEIAQPPKPVFSREK